MKIGILTYHSVGNFGANLQAYATYHVLNKMGHNAKIIDYYPSEMEQVERKNCSNIQFNEHRAFIKKMTVLTNRCQNDEDLAETCIKEKFDHILIGADAVFLLDKKVKDFKNPNPFWANWIFTRKELSNTKVSSLSASSMGTNFNNFSKQEQEDLNQNLKGFNTLTVRDEWTKKEFQKLSQREIIVTPDPVSYLKSTKKRNDKNKYILFSAINNEFINEIWINNFIDKAHSEGLEVGLLPTTEGVLKGNFDFTIDFPIDPLEWLEWIANSQGYVGMRFHPVVIAIFNEIPFVALDHYVRYKYRYIANKRTSKTYDLCKKYGYENQWYNIKKSIPSEKVIIEKLKNFKINNEIAKKSSENFQSVLEKIIK